MAQAIVIRSKVDEGLSLATDDGSPLHLAVVDGSGNIVKQGAEVSKAVFKAAVDAYDSFWQGSGHMTTISTLQK